MPRLRLFIGLICLVVLASSMQDARAGNVNQPRIGTTLRLRSARAPAKMASKPQETEPSGISDEPEAIAPGEHPSRLLPPGPIGGVRAEEEAFRFGSTAFAAVHSRPQRRYQRGGLGPIVPDTRRRPLGW